MNPFSFKAGAAIAATVALSAVAVVIPQTAQAFLITRSESMPSNINAPLAAPTVINFNGLTNPIPGSATSIGPGSTNDGLNGGAKIQLASGSADYFDNQLRIGQNLEQNSPRNGEVRFGFDHPKGMGYLGFSLVARPNNSSQALITFLRQGQVIRSFGVDTLLSKAGSGNYFSFFVTKDSDIFDQVRFIDNSQGNNQALIIDNLAYQAIPTPALLPGLLALGAGLARKKKAQAEAEA